MELKLILWCLTIYLQLFSCNCDLNITKSHGIQVSVKDVPFLILVTTESRTRWCSGALIDVNYVITSAHCAYSDNGFVEITGSEDKYNLLVPCKFILHEAYTDLMNFKRATSHDIAFAKLEFNVKFSEYVKPIKIEVPPWPLSKTTEKSCEIVGFYKIHDHYHRFVTNKYLVKYGIKKCDCIPFKHVACLKSDAGELCIGENGSLLVCNKKLVALHSRRLPHDICLTNESMRIPKCYTEKSFNVFTYLPSHIGWIEQFIIGTEHKMYIKAPKSKSNYRPYRPYYPHYYTPSPCRANSLTVIRSFVLFVFLNIFIKL